MTGPVELADDVARIELLGAPRAVLVDVEALGAEETPAGAQVRRLLTALGLGDVLVIVVPLIDGPSLTGPTVAIFGRDHPPMEDCYAWYVGPGPKPSWMHATAGGGARTSARILSLLGTGFAQERAGAAFRAAGAGRSFPRSAGYDAAAILGGITRAVAPPTAGRGAPVVLPVLDDEMRRQLLRKSVAALDRCCAPGGAIAAAPPASSEREPDYWFFWQRDAAHVAVALHALAGSGPDEDARGWARTRLDAYVAFIAELGPALARDESVGVSRCTMAGRPVGDYGDPQPDGPAATALGVLSVVEDPHWALAIARPFLDYLLTEEASHESFDLWELTVGTSFHAVNLGRRALRRAADVAAAASDPAAAAYSDAAGRQALRLNAFRDPERRGLIHVDRPRPPWFGATSRLDMSVVGSVLLGYDVTDDAFNVDDPDLVATVGALEDHFAARWPVNAAWQQAGHVGGGIGRFPEDCNDGIGSTGGNPWPVTTLWAAQHHLRRAQRSAYLAGRAPAASRPAAGDRVSVDSGSGDRTAANLSSDDATGQGLQIARARGYLSFVIAHTDVAAISEQIDGTTGLARGARPLAWAHAELVTTLLALGPLA